MVIGIAVYAIWVIRRWKGDTNMKIIWIWYSHNKKKIIIDRMIIRIPKIRVIQMTSNLKNGSYEQSLKNKYMFAVVRITK